jgi:Phage P22-like portal protein
MTDIAAQDDTGPAVTDDQVVREGLDRWKACKEWQGTEDEHTRDDIKFANGDARNTWQWPARIYEQRTGEGGGDLPALTINNTRTHNDIIINQMSKQGFAAKIRPVGGKASYKSAQVMQSIIDRIMYISKGSSQRRKVAEQQVDGGIGYMLIETQYVSNKTRDQDIRLRASRDPTGVYLDPWIREPDGSDANFGFVFERLPRKEFNRKYPKYKDVVASAPLDNGFEDWISDKEIMLCKYFRKKQNKDTFVWYEIEDGPSFEGLASDIKDDAGKEIYKALMEDIKLEKVKGGKRSVTNDEVEWFLIAGNKIVEKGEWAGKYIPICRAVGREVVIDATLDRKGHTRPLIDAQRMLNYNASVAVEVVALQPKASFMAPARSLEGQEQYKTLNIDNFPVLLYNDIDDEAPTELQRIDPPVRLDPPKTSTAHIQGMQDAERQMMMISGQWQSETGQNSNSAIPESGKAIGERKEAGETATYHFVEHMADMDRFIGVQLLDLIPKIYDTRRAIHIEGDDGEKSWLQIDPDQQEAVIELEKEREDEEAATLAFNPKIGEYECISDPGPDFATQRQEAWTAGVQILQQNMELSAVIGDLLFRNGDFAGADEIAERLQKEIKATKPYLFDENAEPQVTALQQQNQSLVQLNKDLMDKLAQEKLKVRGRDERNDIKAYAEETARMKVQIEALMMHVLTPKEQAQMQHELGMQSREHIFDTIKQANEANIDKEDDEEGNNEEPPVMGARKAKDGHHYLADPHRPGKWLKVVKRAA